MYDVVIVGGGPAGLSAALVLGRCGRRVVVCDSGTPRNAVSTALHGYLTRDGVPPLELLRLGRQELRAYEIEFREVSVTDITRADAGFTVTIGNSEQLHAHSVLLATGLRDELPAVPGIEECYGITVHHCPYCDGWEHRRKALAVIGDGAGGAGLALSLKTWSDLVVLCTNGEPRLNRKQQEQLALHEIPVRQERLERIVHENGHVREIVRAGGSAIQCDAIFFGGKPLQQSELAKRLGCEFNRKGTVKTDNLGETCVSGVYVVGDASRDVQFAVVAAAEGAKAGVAINKALQARAGLVVTSGT